MRTVTGTPGMKGAAPAPAASPATATASATGTVTAALEAAPNERNVAPHLPGDVVDEVCKRLRRAGGQVGAVERMLAEGRDCREVITQLSAAIRALEQAGFRLLAGGLSSCLEQAGEAGEAGEAGGVSAGDARALFEELFLKLS